MTELVQRRRDFDDRMNASEARIKDAEKNVALTIDRRFKQELDQVRTTKADTIKAITNKGLNADGKVDKALSDAQAENLSKINNRGTELYYQLQKPTWRQLVVVGFKINWLLWAASGIALVLSLIAIIRTR
jgi:hypothetical protein